jgi:uncharacterized membrane protein YedE/YeeE
MNMHPWILSLIGGVLIGLAAVLLLAGLGRIAGISGIAAGLVEKARDRGWRVAFVLGLVLGPGVWWLFSGHDGIGLPQVGWPWMLGAGLLVGVGTRIGSGCTSGHGVCGVARLSLRSVLATVVFVVLGMLATWLVRHVLGAGV